MDLHVTSDKATPEERAAVDSALENPESGRGDALSHMKGEGPAAFNGQPVLSKRHLLLPVLHAIQERIGWISRGALNYASLQLGVPPAEAHGVASFYEMFSLMPRPPVTPRRENKLAAQRVPGPLRACARRVDHRCRGESTRASSRTREGGQYFGRGC